MGTDVFTANRSGATARVRRKGKNPRTPAQLAIRANLTKASGTFKNLSASQIAAWQTYANSIVKRNPVTGKAYSPTALNAYTTLATKLLQINAGLTLPTTPPTSAFTGDTVTVTTTASPGQVTFTASAANAANVKTELLLQPLKSKNRTPNPKGYRTRAFVAFAAGSLTQTITVPTGYYVGAYRFVNTTTGQATALTPLPLLTVALSVEDGGLADAAPAAKKKAA